MYMCIFIFIFIFIRIIRCFYAPVNSYPIFVLMALYTHVYVPLSEGTSVGVNAAVDKD